MKPEVVHHNREAHDIVENLIGAHWTAAERFGCDFNEDDFVTEEMWLAYLNYWPSDPQEAAEWEEAEERFDRSLTERLAEVQRDNPTLYAEVMAVGKMAVCA